MCNCHNEKNKCSCGCGCDENCTCGCQEGKECTCGCNCDCGCDCNCGCHGISDKEMAFELCKTLIEGRTYTAEKTAETYKILYEAIKSCN